MIRVLLLGFAVLVSHTALAELPPIKISADGKGFVHPDSGLPFVPVGFNYDHEGDGKLIEDYWVEEWPLVESAFAEMKSLGANVVRIHLQFGKFMQDPKTANRQSLNQLGRLLQLAEHTGLYLDITGLGCYHKPDIPLWYDNLSETDRWAAQAVFWEGIAKTCSGSSAVFCYDLMNEPVVGGAKKREDWLGPGFGDKYFVQFICLETKGREREQIALAWTRRLVAAIRKHDTEHLVTIGMVPWSLNRPGMTSGFDPQVVAGELDFIAMHIYPESGKIDDAIETVKGFAAFGKPVVIEETFVLKCGADDLGKFIDGAIDHATGLIGFYWGKTPAEYRPPKSLPEAFALNWLELFTAKREQIVSKRTRVPQSVQQLWSEFDPRSAPLNVRVIRQWEQDDIFYRYVTFHVGIFKQQPARLAAFYAFPKDRQQLPGLLHLHGGGQRAFQHEVRYYAQRGYACLSLNWGGREMEDAKPEDENTNWGAVDPTQQNVPGYANLQPGDRYLDPVPSPRNNNWFLLSLAARRGLTFLEEQPEVDPERLGVYGHSMGGNLTVYVAGTDDRVKVAAPSVGGQGFRTVASKLLPQQRRKKINGDVELYRRTLGFQAYAPLINAPLLWLGSTNDFHGIMDDTYRTGELIPAEGRYSFAPHLNHRFTPPFAIARPLWIDQHLKARQSLPSTPDSELILPERQQPRLIVRPDTSMEIADVQVYYSIDPDPQARYWRSAAVEVIDGAWSAELPIMSTEDPLFAYANVHYRLAQADRASLAPPTSTVAISSDLHTADLDVLRNAGVAATDSRSNLIEDFTNQWRDWYQLSANNPHHWQFWTRKVNDPKYRGRPNEQLALEVKSIEPNQLVIVLTENFFRSYRGKQIDFVAVVDLNGGDEFQKLMLSPNDFKSAETGDQLKSWSKIDLLGLRAFYDKPRSDTRIGSRQWAGPQPTFNSLRWVPEISKPQ